VGNIVARVETDAEMSRQHLTSSKVTRLIVFCGVDGAGKTSLVNALERRGIPNAAFIRRNKCLCLSLLDRYYSRVKPNPSDWVSGTFAETIAHAAFIDFLIHFDENIRPLIGRYEYLFCDRYLYCFIAYLRVVRPELEILSVLSAIPAPDLVIHVTTEMARLTERYENRGGASEDESIELMSKLDREYRTLFESLGGRAVRVENNGSLEEAIDAVQRCLTAKFPELAL
jgi:thymidylate kinase